MSKRKSNSINWKERRRYHALKLKRSGWKQSDIALALDVSKGAVSQWIKIAEEEGKAGLRARPHTGRIPDLTFAEKQLIPDLLSHGAEAYGFRGDIWTCARVRKVIEWEYGVSYHKSHVARVLKDLRWTPQMPMERASQRDEVAIARWRSEIWREMKKKRVWSGESWFSWMNRAFICCPPRSARTRPSDTRPSCAFFRRKTICP